LTSATVDGAAVRMKFPPALYALPLAGGISLHSWLIALPIGGRPATTALGAALTVAGLAFSLSGTATILGRRTTVVPHRAVTALVTTGPYRVSRNPMYTGLAVAYTGVALWVATWWPLLVLPLVVAAVHTMVIVPEESYLAERFPAAYADYRSRVRRWF